MATPGHSLVSRKAGSYVPHIVECRIYGSGKTNMWHIRQYVAGSLLIVGPHSHFARNLLFTDEPGNQLYLTVDSLDEGS